MARHMFDKFMEELLTSGKPDIEEYVKRAEEERQRLTEESRHASIEMTKDMAVTLAELMGLLNKELKKNKVSFPVRHELVIMFFNKFMGGIE